MKLQFLADVKIIYLLFLFLFVVLFIKSKNMIRIKWKQKYDRDSIIFSSTYDIMLYNCLPNIKLYIILFL